MILMIMAMFLIMIIILVMAIILDDNHHYCCHCTLSMMIFLRLYKQYKQVTCSPNVALQKQLGVSMQIRDAVL